MTKRLNVLLMTVAAAFTLGTADARTLRIADQGDALSMDPHSLNESLQLSFTGNLYEALVGRDKKLGLTPALATEWKQTSPTVWRFKLRRGVVFHDGTPFTANDVVFSFKRAGEEGSDMKGYVGPIKEVIKVDDLTVDIVRKAVDPALPDAITNMYVMIRAWSQDNNAARPRYKRK